MTLRTKILALTAAAGILAAGAIAIPAAAQDGGDPPATETRQERRDEFLARVAGKLGVEPAALEQAMKDVQLELVDEALANGRITDEQATKARERIESGQGPAFGQFKDGLPGRGKHERAMKVRGALLESAAAAIGISKDELKEQIKGGASIAEAAAASGVSVDDVKASIISDAQAKLAEAVANGRIDQARADQSLAQLNERLDDLVNRKRSAPAE